jgi:hypothetical protein
MKIKQNISIKKFRKSEFQNLFLLIVMFGMIAFFPIPAQAKVDEQSLEKALKILNRETRVPVKVPANLNEESDEEYFYVVIIAAQSDFYELHFDWTPGCGGTACHNIYISGEKITPQIKKPAGKRINLAGYKNAFYEDSSCGASCGDDALSWEENGFRYTVGSKAGSLESTKKIAASATKTIKGEFLDKIYPDLKVFKEVYMQKNFPMEFEAEGDLNGDGLKDWAGLIQRKLEDADEPWMSESLQLYLLLQQKNGGYKIAEKSNETELGGLGGTYFENLEIKNSSVYLQINSKGADYVEPHFYQFKLYKGEWRLIGYRTFHLEISADDSVETDRNLLTGAVIVKKQKGEAKPVVRQSSKKFPKFLLKDFDFSIYLEE